MWTAIVQRTSSKVIANINYKTFYEKKNIINKFFSCRGQFKNENYKVVCHICLTDFSVLNILNLSHCEDLIPWKVSISWTTHLVAHHNLLKKQITTTAAHQDSFLYDNNNTYYVLKAIQKECFEPIMYIVAVWIMAGKAQADSHNDQD